MGGGGGSWECFITALVAVPLFIHGYHILEDSERSNYTTFLIQLSLTAIMWRTLTHLLDNFDGRTKPSPTLLRSTISIYAQPVSQPAFTPCLNLHAVCAQPEKRAHKDPRWLGFEGIAKIIARFVIKSSIYKDD
jgi:hypothetical protein